MIRSQRSRMAAALGEGAVGAVLGFVPFAIVLHTGLERAMIVGAGTGFALGAGSFMRTAAPVARANWMRAGLFLGVIVFGGMFLWTFTAGYSGPDWLRLGTRLTVGPFAILEAWLFVRFMRRPPTFPMTGLFAGVRR